MNGIAKHTPGPWKYAKDAFGNYNIGDHTMTGFGGEAGEPEEIEANARLIAAAPDLLAVAKEFVRKCESAGIKDFNMDLLPAARSAIAKAGGSHESL